MISNVADIVEISAVQTLMEQLWEATAIPNGIVGKDGKVLVATGWQAICTEFHRKHPLTAARCRESNRYLTDHLGAGVRLCRIPVPKRHGRH